LANKAVSKHQLFKQGKRKPAAMPEVLLDAEDADDDDGAAHDTDNDVQRIANYFSSSSVWEGRRLVEDWREIELHDSATLHTENHEQVTLFQHFHSVTSDSGFHSPSMLKDY
jgi:hypothetical protein